MAHILVKETKIFGGDDNRGEKKMLLATPPDLWTPFLSLLGFATIMITLYIFREKRTSRLPADVSYDYEGAVSNPKLDLQIDRNAYLHTLAPTYKGAMYGLQNDRRKRRR